MKRFIYLFLAVPCFLMAQEQQDRFRLGATYAPQFLLKQDFDNLKTGYCYATGLNGSLRIGKFRVELGGNYRSRNYRLANMAFGNLDSQTGASDSTASMITHSTYIEVPLVVKFEVAAFRRLSLTTGVGVAHQFLLSEKSTYATYRSNGSKIRDYESYTTKGNLSLTGVLLFVGADYSLTPRFHVVLEPFISRYFIPKKMRPWDIGNAAVGMNLKVQYAFN